MPKTVWRVHSVMPEDNYMFKDLLKFGDAVKTITNGQLEIKAYPNSSLGYTGQEILRVLRDGLVDASDISGGYVEGDAPILGISQFPYLIQTYAEGKKIMPVMLDVYGSEVAKWGGVLLSVTTYPEQYLFANKPIKSMADFKGMKLRTYSAYWSQVTQDAGASAVNIPAAELYNSLQRGIAEGTWTATTTAQSFKLYEVLKTTNKVGAGLSLGMFAVNKKAWDAVPAAYQAQIKDAANKILVQQMWADAEKDSDTALAFLNSKGMAYNEAPPEVVSALTKLASAGWDKWGAKVGPDGVAALNKIRQPLGR